MSLQDHVQTLHTPAIANVGLIGGSAAILTTCYGLFKVLSDPDELVALWEATKTHTDPTHAVARLVGAGIAMVGALMLSMLAAYVGRPSLLKPPQAAAGGEAGTPPVS